MDTATFKTRDSELRDHNGETVAILRPLTDDEIDMTEVGPMYRIAFPDGTVTDAFADELKER